MIYAPELNAADSDADGGFGRNKFTLVSEEAKNLYLAECFRHSLGRIRKPDSSYFYEDHEMIEIVRDKFGSDIAQYMIDDWVYVDHQSVITFPVKYHKRDQIDFWFFKEIQEAVLKEGVIICGGCDESEPHWIVREGHGQPVVLPSLSYNNNVVRKDHWTDPDGNFCQGFTLFNPDTGHQRQYLLGEFPNLEGEVVDYTPKLQAPLLADLKITDKCPYKCSFCYQSSLPQAPHGDLSYIKSVVDQLSDLKVFEIAYGGGEPTLFPGFAELLQYTKSKGIVPNFTTKNLKWLGTDLEDVVVESCGAFAYSVHSLADLKAFLTAFYENSRLAARFADERSPEYRMASQLKAAVQLVMGTVPFEEFKEIMALLGEHREISVTLLGFKSVGFGDGHAQYDYSEWVKWFKEARDN
ncbi:MAG: radical SAM protein, partial [Bacteroidota bacterium]